LSRPTLCGSLLSNKLFYSSVAIRCVISVVHVCAVGGLGMRVVGGKLGDDKKLGTYVSTVVPGGVADKAGIVKGQSSISLTHVSRLRLSVLSCLQPSSVRRLAALWTISLHCRRSSTCRVSRFGLSPVRVVTFRSEMSWVFLFS